MLPFLRKWRKPLFENPKTKTRPASRRQKLKPVFRRSTRRQKCDNQKHNIPGTQTRFLSKMKSVLDFYWDSF